MTTLFPPPPPADDMTPGRLLVVDDEPQIRTLVARILTAAGHAVDLAGGTDEALARLAGREYDVALVDLEMPGRGGLELLRDVQAAGRVVVPVMLTGTRDVGTAVAAMKQGVFEYLPKPVAPEALRWTVARAVGVARTRRRERALERVAADWAATFDACPDLLLVLDPIGRVLRANAAAARRAGADPHALTGRAVADVFPGPLGAAIATPGAADGGRVYDPGLGGYFEVTVDPVRAGGRPPPGVVVVARDVSAAERDEAMRAKLFRQVVTVQEDERARISRELHDGVGQALVSLAVGLAAVADGPADGAARDRVRRLRQVAADALTDIRRMAQGLRPTVLDDLGLVAALARLTETFSDVHAVRAELVVTAPDAGRLPAEVESAVYRIVQEALANVGKHSRARTVDVVLDVAAGDVRVQVSDDGAGFAAAATPRPHHAGLGLTGMRERAVTLGGTLRVESVPGLGTTIDVRIPVPGGEP